MAINVGPTPHMKFLSGPRRTKEYQRLLKLQSESSITTQLYTDLDFTASNITSIVNRAHDNLQSMSGGGTYHLSAAQYANLTSTIRIKSVTDSITAGSTQTQAGATALTTEINRVTIVGTNGDGVKLPTAVAGYEILIINDDAAQNIQIWPASGDAIDGGSADAADGNTLAAGSARRYITTDTTNWYTA